MYIAPSSVLELLSGRCSRLHSQAAFLEMGIVAGLAKLIMGLVNESEEESQITAACTMALEVVTVLFNYDICLNPTLPVSQRITDDMPTIHEVSLFSQLPGSCARKSLEVFLVLPWKACLLFTGSWSTWALLGFDARHWGQVWDSSCSKLSSDPLNIQNLCHSWVVSSSPCCWSWRNFRWLISRYSSIQREFLGIACQSPVDQTAFLDCARQIMTTIAETDVRRDMCRLHHWWLSCCQLWPVWPATPISASGSLQALGATQPVDRLWG